MGVVDAYGTLEAALIEPKEQTPVVGADDIPRGPAAEGDHAPAPAYFTYALEFGGGEAAPPR